MTDQDAINEAITYSQETGEPAEVTDTPTIKASIMATDGYCAQASHGLYIGTKDGFWWQIKVT